MRRTFKELLYVSPAVFDHFKLLRDKYYQVTHKDGSVCVRDKLALRKITESIRKDTDIRREFDALSHPDMFLNDDGDKVFVKYTSRIETLMGNEVARQYMDLLKQSKKSSMEQLRAFKKKRRLQIKNADDSKRKRTVM